MMQLADLLAAASRSAAMVYHAVVRAEANVTAWQESHPIVGPLVNEAVVVANAMLAKTNLYQSAGVAGTDILAALKALAVSDATVPSIIASAVQTPH